MHDAGVHPALDAMRVREPAQHVEGDDERDIGRQSARCTLEHLAQRDAGDVLHRDERALVVAADIEHVDDVGMVQPRRDLGLVEQRLDMPRGLIRRHPLDDDEPVEVELAREHDLAHAAAAERTHDLVSPRDQRHG